MSYGYYIICPGCGTKIGDDEWSCADEWFCDCGQQGICEYEDEDEDEDE